MAKRSRILLKGTDKRLDHNQGHKDQNYLQEVSSMSAQLLSKQPEQMILCQQIRAGHSRLGSTSNTTRGENASHIKMERNNGEIAAVLLTVQCLKQNMPDHRSEAVAGSKQTFRGQSVTPDQLEPCHRSWYTEFMESSWKDQVIICIIDRMQSESYFRYDPSLRFILFTQDSVLLLWLGLSRVCQVLLIFKYRHFFTINS